jgi:hypothetical protein
MSMTSDVMLCRKEHCLCSLFFSSFSRIIAYGGEEIKLLSEVAKKEYHLCSVGATIHLEQATGYSIWNLKNHTRVCGRRYIFIELLCVLCMLWKRTPAMLILLKRRGI